MTLPHIIRYTIILLVVSTYAHSARCSENVIETPRPLPIQLTSNAKRAYSRGVFHGSGHDVLVLDSLRSEEYAEKIIEIVNNQAIYIGDAINDTIIIIDNSYTKDYFEIFAISNQEITNQVTVDGNIEIFKYPNNKSVVQRIIDDYERKYFNYNSDTIFTNIASELKIINENIIVRIIDDYEKKYCSPGSGYISIATEVIIANDSIISIESCQYPPPNPFSYLWNLATDFKSGKLKIDTPIRWRRRRSKVLKSYSFDEILFGPKVPEPFKVAIPSLPDSINLRRVL